VVQPQMPPVGLWLAPRSQMTPQDFNKSIKLES